MNVHVDAGRRTFLGLCACGARVFALSHERALVLLAEHEQHAHPGHNHARDALRRYRERHADTLAR